MRAGIVGVGAALPDQVVTNAALVDRLDTSDEWIVKRTGIRERHRLGDTVTLADLATQACARALTDAGRAAEDVDRVLVATMTADRITPGLAPEIAENLGAFGAGAVDLNAACAGFLYALDEAAALVESGRSQVALVCGAEALSRITDPQDRATAVLFGDGAGAVVLAAGADADASWLGLTPFELGADGSQIDLLYADGDERLLRMHGREVYRHAVRRMTEATRAALARAGLEVGDLDAFVAHQANARIVEAAAAELGIAPERVVLNLEHVANTSSASIPIALEQAERDGLIGPGSRVGLAAFGAGFVWAAGVIGYKEHADVAA